MTDDDLVDRAAVNNLMLMRAIGDRAIIRQKVVHFYEDLASRAAAQQDNSRVGSSVDADMCL
jgi:hypothetical protein